MPKIMNILELGRGDRKKSCDLTPLLAMENPGQREVS